MQPLAARPPAPRPCCSAPYWQSADGDQASIDLNGPGPGSITTSLSTLSGWTSGATYRVSFSLAANPDNTLSPQSCVRATTATHQQDYCFNVLNVDGQGTPASSANMGWQRHTFEFTGAPTDHLTFTSLVSQGDVPGGTQLWCCGGKGVYQGWQPDFVTMYHELVGETLKYRAGYGYLRRNPTLDDRTVIKIENEIRQFHGMNPRTGADHGMPVITVKGTVQ